MLATAFLILVAHVSYDKGILTVTVYVVKSILLFNPYSAGIDFSRQILTGIDFSRQILATKVDPRTVRVKTFLMTVDI